MVLNSVINTNNLLRPFLFGHHSHCNDLRLCNFDFFMIFGCTDDFVPLEIFVSSVDSWLAREAAARLARMFIGRDESVEMVYHHLSYHIHFA